MKKNKLIVIDDKIAYMLLADKRFMSEFPSVSAFLQKEKEKPVAAAAKGCKPCQARSAQAAASIISIKKALSQLSAEDKVKFKDYMSTSHVKVVFKSQDNKIVQIDF